MHINWIDVAGLLVVLWVVYDRIKKLEAANRRLEIQCNTNEMNLKKLYFFRDLEVYEQNSALSDEERQGFKDELNTELHATSPQAV
ncbi:MAG: hypothetical protein ACTHNZ_23885 [Trinickia sp.]|uniref:hypothetical protein n=1 Tax=Trinickia sp. TaxID=2571163 RepID=UPI003F80AC63